MRKFRPSNLRFVLSQFPIVTCVIFGAGVIVGAIAALAG